MFSRLVFPPRSRSLLWWGAAIFIWLGGGVVAARLTDRQKKKIIADYIELGSYSAAAKINGVSRNTVKAVVNANPGTAGKCRQKKEENTAAVLAHMEAKNKKACDIMDKMLDALDDEQKLKKTGAQSLATALGILIDKFLCTPLEMEKLKAQTASLRGEDGHTLQAGDDPITQSLKEHFKGG